MVAIADGRSPFRCSVFPRSPLLADIPHVPDQLTGQNFKNLFVCSIRRGKPASTTTTEIKILHYFEGLRLPEVMCGARVQGIFVLYFRQFVTKR